MAVVLAILAVLTRPGSNCRMITIYIFLFLLSSTETLESGSVHPDASNPARNVAHSSALDPNEILLRYIQMTTAAPIRLQLRKVNFYRCDGAESGASKRMLSRGALPMNLHENSFHQPDSVGNLRCVPGS